MVIQLQLQHLTILKLELELLAVEPRIVLVDNPIVVRTDDNDVRGVIVLRMGEVGNVVSLDNAVSTLTDNQNLNVLALPVRQDRIIPRLEQRAHRHWNGHPIIE